MPPTIPCANPEIARMPNMHVDEFGNVNVLTRKSGEGLRHKYDYLMEVDVNHLKDAPLANLLNWMRWGATQAVMWECTLPELISFIERWESVNDHEQSLYYKGNWPEEIPNWEIFWKTHGFYERIRSSYRCRRCATISIFNHLPCRMCGTDGTHDEVWKNIVDGPRGEGTYNLALWSRDGVYVSFVSFLSRGTERAVPTLNHR